MNRLRAESGVRESEQRFSRLFESAMDAIFEMDDEFGVQRANGSAATLFALSDQALTKRKITDLLTSGSARKLRSVAEGLDSAGHPFAWRSIGSGDTLRACESRVELFSLPLPLPCLSEPLPQGKLSAWADRSS